MLGSSFKKEQPAGVMQNAGDLKNVGVLSLEGDIRIEDAAQFKDLLMRHMEDADDLSINISNVTQVDLSCFQIICSAHRFYSRMNKNLSLDGEIPENIRTLAIKSGFKRHKGCALDSGDTCIWMRI
ncbi:MAG: STAS domain-containing protein [Nitrospirae bacterium]|nr:STAS domain-containing protein [Nitrospirota bacterium]